MRWIYLRLLLTHLGFNYPFIKWIFSCIKKSSFAVLINGAASPFFHAERGLRQGCPVSPLLFLLVVEGLSRAILDAKGRGLFEGLRLSTNTSITHLLFVDNILILFKDSKREAERLSEILTLFCKATGMRINLQKSSFTVINLEEEMQRYFQALFPYQQLPLDDRIHAWDSDSNQIATKKRFGTGCLKNWNLESTTGAIDGSQELAD